MSAIAIKLPSSSFSRTVHASPCEMSAALCSRHLWSVCQLGQGPLENSVQGEQRFPTGCGSQGLPHHPGTPREGATEGQPQSQVLSYGVGLLVNPTLQDRAEGPWRTALLWHHWDRGCGPREGLKWGPGLWVG